MTDLSALAVDPKLTKEGKWSTWLGIRLKIRPASSADFKARVQELLIEEHVRRREAGAEPGEELDTATRLAITQQAAGELILVDWEDLEYQGEAVPYSQDRSVEFLQDARFEPLWNYVESEASSGAGYRENPQAFEEAIEGLLGKQSRSADSPLTTTETSSKSSAS